MFEQMDLGRASAAAVSINPGKPWPTVEVKFTVGNPDDASIGFVVPVIMSEDCSAMTVTDLSQAAIQRAREILAAALGQQLP